MSFITKILATAVAVLIAARFLSGIHIDGVLTAVLVAVVLGLLNTFIKPILIILTIPITVITLGLFLLVINVLIIKWAADIVPGFKVDNWMWALLFGFIVSIISSFINGLIKKSSN
jgi:Predicted membrane protein